MWMVWVTGLLAAAGWAAAIVLWHSVRAVKVRELVEAHRIAQGQAEMYRRLHEEIMEEKRTLDKALAEKNAKVNSLTVDLSVLRDEMARKDKAMEAMESMLQRHNTLIGQLEVRNHQLADELTKLNAQLGRLG